MPTCTNIILCYFPLLHVMSYVYVHVGWTEAGEYLVYIEDQSTTLKTVEILRTIKR